MGYTGHTSSCLVHSKWNRCNISGSSNTMLGHKIKSDRHQWSAHIAQTSKLFKNFYAMIPPKRHRAQQIGAGERQPPQTVHIYITEENSFMLSKTFVYIPWAGAYQNTSVTKNTEGWKEMGQQEHRGQSAVSLFGISAKGGKIIHTRCLKINQYLKQTIFKRKWVALQSHVKFK